MALFDSLLAKFRGPSGQEEGQEPLPGAEETVKAEERPEEDGTRLMLSPEHAVYRLWGLWRAQADNLPPPDFRLTGAEGMPEKWLRQELMRLQMAVNAAANRRASAAAPQRKEEDTAVSDLNAEVEVFLSEDQLFAWLYVFPPVGGGKELVIRRVTEKKREKTEKINKSALNNRLDCGRIIGTVRLRAKAPGDRMAPAWRRAGSHPLKKLCQEAGVPPEQRQVLAVAEDSRGIIWAEGFGADRRCAWREGSTAGCVFEIRRTEESGNGNGES